MAETQDTRARGKDARPPRPYADAPCLPATAGGDEVDVRRLVKGAEYELEIGPGRGGFVFERLASAPEVAMLGLEVRRKWASIVDLRLAKHGLGPRARVFAEDAKLALARLGPDEIFTRVFVHFPDPWWKKRHNKRLVLTADLLEQIARLLAPRGELFVQTDVAERAAEYESLLETSSTFRAAGDVEGSARLTENPYGARSPRERRAVQDGLPIYRLRYAKATAPREGSSL
jgi:tRNA (guanine-N7-)-methyltransferase